MQNQLINIETLEKDQHLTAAYEDFKDRICYKYLMSLDTTDFSKLHKKMKMIPGNSTPCCNLITNCLHCLYWGPVFNVEKNKFAFVKVYESSGTKTYIYGPGYHMLGYFSKFEGIYSFDQKYPNNIIESQLGDLKIVRVY